MIFFDDIFISSSSSSDLAEKYKKIGLPFQVWKREYEKNSQLLIDEIINPLCDYNVKSIYSGNVFAMGANRLTNYERYNGKFDNLEEDYAKMFLFGDFMNEDEEPLRDFNFYWYAVSRIQSEALRTDLKFTVNIINREAGEKRKARNSEIGAEAMMNQIIENIRQKTGTPAEQAEGAAPEDGIDLSFAKRKDIIVPNKMEELMQMLNDKEISSAQTYTLLNHVKEKYNLKREIYAKNLQDKCKINACFGLVEINNENDPVYRRIAPQNITWVGPAELGGTGFDECCDAVQISEMIPITKALTMDRGFFELNLDTANKINEYINSLVRDKKMNELGPTSLGLKDVEQDQYGTFWSFKLGSGLHVCRQHLFFKMIHPVKCLVKIKGRNITPDEMKEFRDYRQNYEDVEFEEVESDYKAGDGEFLVTIPTVKLHEAIRYGNEFVVMHREYPIQQRNTNNIIETKYPLAACVWPDKSIVSLGHDFGYLYHFTMKKLMEEIKQLSVSDMINWDVDTLPDGYTFEMIPVMIKEKLNIFSGSKMVDYKAGKESNRHLTSTKVSVSPNEIIALLNMAMAAANTYYRIIGIPIETNIIQKQETQNRNQESPVQGSLALIPFYDEFIEEFVNQVLQKLADIGRYAWSRDKTKQVILGKGQTDLLSIDSSLPLDEQGVFVVNDYKSAMDKRFLMDAGMKAISSGALGFGEIVKMYYSENPEQILAMFNEGMSVLEKLEKQKQESAAAANEANQQLAAAKMNIPLQREQMITDRLLKLQDQIDKNKDEREAAKMESKGEGMDIKFAQDMAKMLREKQIEDDTKEKDHVRAKDFEVLSKNMEASIEKLKAEVQAALDKLKNQKEA